MAGQSGNRVHKARDIHHRDDGDCHRGVPASWKNGWNAEVGHQYSYGVVQGEGAARYGNLRRDSMNARRHRAAGHREGLWQRADPLRTAGSREDLCDAAEKNIALTRGARESARG